MPTIEEQEKADERRVILMVVSTLVFAAREATSLTSSLNHAELAAESVDAAECLYETWQSRDLLPVDFIRALP